MATPKEIFDTAITLTEGDKLVIPCHSARQQESLRVSLAYHRRRFLEDTKTGFDFQVTKLTRGGVYSLQITKVPRLTEGIIISEDGTSRRVSLESTQEQTTGKVVLDVARIVQAMREDGLSEEEISSYLKANGLEETSNFDTSGIDEDTCLRPEKLDE